MKTTVILGAGFSKNSNIPVMSELPRMLIEEGNSQLDLKVANVVKTFLKDVFGMQYGEFPALDDIFTCIDISTNSGHHLGISYSPLRLRAIRRFLVYKVFKLLEEPFILSEDVKTLVMRLLGSPDTSFIVLNWDCVLEKYITCISENYCVNYCNGGVNLHAEESYNKESYNKENYNKREIKILKVHGSCNWLYCDNCRSVFADLENEIPVIKRAGIQRNDLELFKDMDRLHFDDILGNIECSVCGNNISSHIATFSYRKSFRVNSFPDIWSEAEKELSSSDRWLFIGYSLPEADYEFKHLLKISELKLGHIRKDKLLVDVVLFNSKSAIKRYEGFFGNSLGQVCNGGIKEYISYLESEKHHI